MGGVPVGKRANSEMWVYSADRKVQSRSTLTFSLPGMSWVDETCASPLSIEAHAFPHLRKEAGSVHFICTVLSSPLAFHHQRTSHFQCLGLVWSHLYLKRWSTFSSRATRVEEKGKFSPESNMERKCPRGKTSTWITIFCCMVTYQNVTIGSSLLIFIICRVNLEIFKIFRVSY